MGLLPGAVQVRLYAPSSSDSDSTVQSWTLPGWILSIASPSVLMGLGETEHPTILHARVAKALGIHDGDVVQFEFVQIGERFRLPVTVRDDVPTAFMIHGAVNPARIASSVSMDRTGETLKFDNGKSFNLGMQSFWKGLGIVPPRLAFAVLEFDGASRNNPDGPSGYGYCVRLAGKDGRISTDRDAMLIQGYGYSPAGGSNNRMEYAGLIEGLWWALLLNIKKLFVCGDSELVVNQVNNTFQVRSATLQDCHGQVETLLGRARDLGIQYHVKHIPRKSNILADSLANLGIDLQENATSVKWVNCNKL